jgi:N-acetylglucosaminyldiphosphoundecaprenol N-acetyl-beta-D-mannosaminyltransferase
VQPEARRDERSLGTHKSIPLVRINGVPLANVTMDEALELVEDAIADRRRRCVFFVNADCINIAATSAQYRSILARPDAWLFGDGVGIRIAGRISRQAVKDNVNGTDMFPRLCERSAANGHSLFLLGARPGIAQEVERRMRSRHPEIRIVGTEHGYHDRTEWPGVVDAINRSQADVLLVGFGAPRQEQWIDEHRAALDAPVVMGVGGLFDYYSGRIPRAPRLVRALTLEWAWRLAMEPTRLWRRYLIGNLVFVARVLTWQLAGRNHAE